MYGYKDGEPNWNGVIYKAIYCTSFVVCMAKTLFQTIHGLYIFLN